MTARAWRTSSRDGRRGDGARGRRRACGADVVVGADGANGIVARAAGLDPGIVLGVALEGNVALVVLPPRPLRRHGRDRARRRCPVATGGCSRRATTPTSASAAGAARARACATHLDAARAERGSAPRRARRRARAPAADAPARRGVPAGGRVLLVGDAAGLVDPLSGDGIYEAFVSARLAADAIVGGRLDEYPARAGGGARPPCRAPRGPRSRRWTGTLRSASGRRARRASSASSRVCSRGEVRSPERGARAGATAAARDRPAGRALTAS